MEHFYTIVLLLKVPAWTWFKTGISNQEVLLNNRETVHKLLKYISI